MFRVLICLTLMAPSFAWAQSESDAAAFQMLEQMLNSPAERAKAAKGDKDATQANNFVNQMPDYAVEEMMAIVMLIMRHNKGEGIANGMDPAQALSKMPPEAKRRIKALEKRLQADPNFNTKQNLNKIQKKMPAKYKQYSKPAGDG